MNTSLLSAQIEEYGVRYEERILSVDRLLEKFIIEDSMASWTPGQQSDYIEEILLGYSPGEIPLDFISLDECKALTVPGKNRLIALRDFVENKFKLTRLIRLPDAYGMTFSDLPNPLQRKFLAKKIRLTIYLPNPNFTQQHHHV